MTTIIKIVSTIILLASLTVLAAHAQTELLGIGADAVQDQTPKKLDSPEAIKEMVARLSDNEVRAILLERLQANHSEKSAQSQQGIFSYLATSFTGISGATMESVQKLPDLGSSLAESFSNFAAEEKPKGLVTFLGYLLGVLAVAYLIERLGAYLTLAWRKGINTDDVPDSLMENLKILGMRFSLEILGLVVFYIAAILLIEQIFAGKKLEVAHLFVWYLVMLPRGIAAVSRFLIAPKRPDLRLVHTDDASAKYLHRHQIQLMALIGFTLGIISFNQINGIQVGELRLGFWLNISIHLYVIYIAWKARTGLSKMMLGTDGDVTPGEAWVARMYPRFLIILSIVMWIIVEIIVVNRRFDLLSGGNHLWTMLILSFAPAMDTAVRGVVRHLVKPMQGEGLIAEKAYESTKRSYIRIGRLIVFAFVVMSISDLWDIDFDNMAEAGLGVQAAGKFIEFLMILVFGYLIWELVTLWINRKLAAEQTAAGMDLQEEEVGGEGGGAGSSRLSTILPLIRVTTQVVISIMTILIALSHVGINITPLLAGAGIVGIAIGFGAQKLVTDIVSGIFFLIDDAFRSGEYVDIEGTVGTVEKISLRSMQLRHHRGHVHTIPYGQIPKITNYSRDWVIMKLKFTVPFETDLNKVKKLFKQIGAEMMEVPEFAEDFIQPFKSQGVLEVDDVGIVVRGKFMAKPGKQFVLRKEIYQRVQKAFEENGLQFARKEVRVKLDQVPDKELTPDDRRAIAAAAAEASEPPPSEQGKTAADPI